MPARSKPIRSFYFISLVYTYLPTYLSVSLFYNANSLPLHSIHPRILYGRLKSSELIIITGVIPTHKMVYIAGIYMLFFQFLAPLSSFAARLEFIYTTHTPGIYAVKTQGTYAHRCESLQIAYTN